LDEFLTKMMQNETGENQYWQIKNAGGGETAHGTNYLVRY
jgi:hypothetical protein